jgi:hypothetical protein
MGFLDNLFGGHDRGGRHGVIAAPMRTAVLKAFE